MEKSVARVSFEDLDGGDAESSTSEAEQDRSTHAYSDEEDEDAEMSGDETRRMVAQQNRKGKKSGGFQSMGRWLGQPSL